MIIEKHNRSNDLSNQPITAIKTYVDELVYDFTTYSDNHSFIANGIVVSNCPAETPEGAQCGLVKNLSLVAAVSLGTSKYPILRLLEQAGITRIDTIDTISLYETRILVNSDLYGVTTMEKTRHIVRILKHARRHGQIASEVSIAWNIKDNEVQVFTDVGRVYRPLRIMEKKSSSISLSKDIAKDWSLMLRSGLVEHIDKLEEETLLIAMNEQQFQEGLEASPPVVNCLELDQGTELIDIH